MTSSVFDMSIAGYSAHYWAWRWLLFCVVTWHMFRGKIITSLFKKHNPGKRVCTNWTYHNDHPDRVVGKQKEAEDHQTEAHSLIHACSLETRWQLLPVPNNVTILLLIQIEREENSRTTQWVWADGPIQGELKQHKQRFVLFWNAAWEWKERDNIR